VLFVEWDGYVVHPDAWKQGFMEYDYIGAKWSAYSDGVNVGNSGFSLLSHKLLKALAEQQLPFNGRWAVDVLICRSALEHQHGIRFAPESVAVKFSYEHEAPPWPTFGFHGMGSMWRYVEVMKATAHSALDTWPSTAAGNSALPRSLANASTSLMIG